ncbi:MAG: pyruvate kinase alpha/beta domain-containing protein, partial [bacterium]
NVIVANTLRQFSQGIKVCAEIAMMAVDCNAIPSGAKVVAVAGSHSGADTAMVLEASESSRMRDMKLHEVLCKPY